ncbi:hypothetical protein A4A49_60549, partial [Nicotiana attenuata]
VLPKTLIWNTRSVNTQLVFPRVINMQMEPNFFVIALMEPFQNARHIQRYRRKLYMEVAFSNINGKIWLFLCCRGWELVL